VPEFSVEDKSFDQPVDIFIDGGNDIETVRSAAAAAHHLLNAWPAKQVLATGRGCRLLPSVSLKSSRVTGSRKTQADARPRRPGDGRRPHP
jgi:hypothetical protein